MVKSKKKQQAARGLDHWLENLLRFEIVVVLFVLIGLYYFLSFSPVRMPKKPIRSPQMALAALPTINQGVKPSPMPGPDGSVAVPVDSRVDLKAQTEVESPVLPASSALEPAAPKTETGVGAVSEARSGLASVMTVDSAVPIVVDQDPVEAGCPVLPKVEVAAGTKTPPAPPAASTTPSSVSLPAGDGVPERPLQVIEAGSYVLPESADKARSELEKLGFTVRSFRRKCQTPMTRIYLGPFGERQQALRMMAAARKLGDNPFLEMEKGTYLVVVGSFYLQSSVVAWENMYHDAGLNPQVRKENLMLPQTVLALDPLRSQDDLPKVLDRIRAAGFNDARLVSSP
ncbi:MAG TPA: SPOR domain-containing protein [Proteobacteria bacterium]|nr:SPOR domain-containing protein [Pseudomonadota bacterium]